MMEAKNSLIIKKILYGGTKETTFRDGTKVQFHFQTCLCDDEKTILDDSRKMGTGKPFELILGKKFKLEVWEAIVQKMAINEVAQFTVNKSLVLQYPFVSKALRDQYLPSDQRRPKHFCAMTMQTEGVGYDDLNAFLKSPSDLQFTIELLEVEQPEDYEKESWLLTEEEKLKKVPELKEKGNVLFREKKYQDAEEQYATAIRFLEQLMLQEKPHDTEWNVLNKQKIPLLLNYAQCKLVQNDFYAVIEHCNTILETEPDNIKALYRRGRAHIGAWNPNKAKEDLTKVMKLNSNLTNTIKNELLLLAEQIKFKNQQDKEKLKYMFN